MIEVLAKAIHHTIKYNDYDIYIVKDNEGNEHVVLIRGEVENRSDVLCRISSECLPGTALFSAECDCQQQIEYSLDLINKENRGVFIYLRQEGRGHGLAMKIRALANKNKGMDTFQAVEQLGVPADVRKYNIVKEIVDYFQIHSLCIICNNPDKINSIEQEGVAISGVVNIPIVPNEYSYRHLKAKLSKGHKINFVDGDSLR